MNREPNLRHGVPNVRASISSEGKLMAAESQPDDAIREMRSHFLVPPSFEDTFAENWQAVIDVRAAGQGFQNGLGLR